MNESEQDIRWKQRLSSFQDAMLFLKESVKKDKHSDLEKAGVIQSFEVAFELAWKTLKDYLNMHGSNSVYPRDVIKDAFQSGLIEDGDIWMQMLDTRNLMSRTYHRRDSETAFQNIVSEYFSALEALYIKLNNLL